MALALYFFSLLPIPVLAAIAAVMYRRKQHLLYPVFWTYLCFQVLSIIVELTTRILSFSAYFYVYWSSSFAILIFNLILFRTIFSSVLKKYSSLDRLRRIGFEVVLAIIWCAALLVTLRITIHGPFLQKIMKAELVVSFTAVGMFLFVVLACRLFGIRWSSHIAGIAMGCAGAGSGRRGQRELVKSASSSEFLRFRKRQIRRSPNRGRWGPAKQWVISIIAIVCSAISSNGQRR